MTTVFEADLYSRAALRDPYPLYARLRAMGPAVWMPKRRMWAIARYDGVRAALRASETLISGHGVHRPLGEQLAAGADQRLAGAQGSAGLGGRL